MDTISFDAWTRRASLIAAGAAGLATLAIPIAGAAKKKNKKKKGDVNKLCKTQIAPCEAFFNDPDRDACCAFWGTCDIAGFFDCLAALVD